jgi:polar amino acid transport system permease protein
MPARSHGAGCVLPTRSADWVRDPFSKSAKSVSSPMSYQLQFGQISEHIPYLLGGAWISLQLALISFGIGGVIGLVCASASLYAGRLSRGAVTFYVSLFTNTPAFIQIYFLFNGLPELGILLPPFVAAAIGLTLVAGAYLTEIERAGFISVRRSEIEAAETLGMGRVQIIQHVIVPHLMRTIYAPLASFFIWMLLGSSIAALIGVEELTGRAINISSSTLRSIEVFLVVAVIYIILSLVCTALLSACGRFFFRVRMRAI